MLDFIDPTPKSENTTSSNPSRYANANYNSIPYTDSLCHVIFGSRDLMIKFLDFKFMMNYCKSQFAAILHTKPSVSVVLFTFHYYITFKAVYFYLKTNDCF